jgi:putative membrane protein
MRGFILRWAIGALALWLASAIVPGMEIRGASTLALAALLLGFVNAVFRPVIILLTLPFTLLTFGLFLLVVNALMLMLVAAFLDDFVLAGFWSALFGAIVVSLASAWVGWTIGPAGRYELMVIQRDTIER